MIDGLKERVNETIVVLVAEDERKVRTAITRVLDGIYNDVYEASDGAEAIEILENNHVDILITDINMPNVCGNDVIKYLAERKDAFVPTIITSAYNSLSKEYRDLQCIRIKDKPYTVENIIQTIEELHASNIVGVCNKLEDAFSKIKKAAIAAKDIMKMLELKEK